MQARKSPASSTSTTPLRRFTTQLIGGVELSQQEKEGKYMQHHIQTNRWQPKSKISYLERTMPLSVFMSIDVDIVKVFVRLCFACKV